MHFRATGQLHLLMCLIVFSLETPVIGQTFPPFSKCQQSDCDSYAAITVAAGKSVYTDARSLQYCCDVFRKCCGQANAIPCPTDDASTLPDHVTVAHFQCPGVGPYCGNDLHCTIGQKCCRNPLYGPSKQPVPGTARNYSCCWSVAKEALASEQTSG